MAAQIKLQQALFGYDGGHQLIAASTTLPTEAKHELAVATDLSGSAPLEGFEQTYTGIPVPETEFYALFSTWLAPEMPRPGCVWSHVLLIDLADVALLLDLAELRTLFRRPKRNLYRQLREPIEFTPNRAALRTADQLSEADCVAILQKLYGSPEIPAVVASESSQRHEELIFRIWSQQWPKLRRSFRFSTGSFADRGRSGPAFDLQVTPLANTGVWRPPGNTLLKYESEAASRGPQLWVKAAAADLIQPNEHGLREFLQTYGADVGAPRAAFSRLTETFEMLNTSARTAWGERLRAVAEFFPKAKEAVRLKTTLVTPPPNLPNQEKVALAWQTAAFLFVDPKANAFANAIPDYSQTAPVLWREKRAEMIQLLGELIRRDENPGAIAFTTAVANAVQASDLKLISEERSELIPLIVSLNSPLAFSPETWQLPGHVQSHVFDVLGELGLSQEAWAKVLGAMLISATYVSVQRVVELAGPFAMKGAYRWLDHPIAQSLVPSEGWRNALSKIAEAELKMTDDLSPSALSLCAWCLSVESTRRVLSAARSDICRLAEQPLDRTPAPLRTHTAFLLMTLGLRAPYYAGADLIARSFFPVHKALATWDYAAESWWLLSPELPFLGWWYDWDKCEKLRKAVGHWFRSNVRSGDRLYDAASNQQERSLAMRVIEEI